MPELKNAVNVSGLSDGLIYILISIVSFISIIFQSAEITISHPVIRVCSNISSHSLFTIDISNIVTQNLEVLFIDHFKLLENYEKYLLWHIKVYLEIRGITHPKQIIIIFSHAESFILQHGNKQKSTLITLFNY